MMKEQMMKEQEMVEEIRAMFSHFHPLWVDVREEDGRFPVAPSREATENTRGFAVDHNGELVNYEIDCFINDRPVFDGDAIVYIGPLKS